MRRYRRVVCPACTAPQHDQTLVGHAETCKRHRPAPRRVCGRWKSAMGADRRREPARPHPSPTPPVPQISSSSASSAATAMRAAIPSVGSDAAHTTAATGPARRASTGGTSSTEAAQPCAASSHRAVAWTRRSAGRRGCATTMMSPACDVAATNSAGSPLMISNSRATPRAAAASSSSRRASRGRGALLLGDLLSIQLMPGAGTQAELADERQRRQFGQCFVLQEHALQRDAEHPREFRRRADDRAFGRTLVQMQDDATRPWFRRHAHVPSDASRPNACRALANAASRSSTRRFTLSFGYRPSSPRSPASRPVSSPMPSSIVRTG